MKLYEAKKIAEAWVAAYARDRAVTGAVYSGSIAERPEENDLPEDSDVDVLILLPQAKTPEKIGKILVSGIFLDVSFLPDAILQDCEALISTYELAGSFRSKQIFYDPKGLLAPVGRFFDAHFGQQHWVMQRCERVFEKIAAGVDQYKETQTVLGNTNAWLFPAGICTHAILVAGQENPTVRLRYLRTRELLTQWNRQDLYESLLALSGFDKLTQEQVQSHLDQLAVTFAQASKNRKSAFPFQNDITEEGARIAIQGSQTLIDQGNHREAVFWITATFERCHKILEADAPAIHAQRWPAFEALLRDLRVDTNAGIAHRISEILAMTAQLRIFLSNLSLLKNGCITG